MPLSNKDLRRYQPVRYGRSEIDERKERFEKLNAFVRSRNGWITSIPGARDVRMECLPGSSLPDELRALGYDVVDLGEEGQRIIPSAITERLEQRADGSLGPITAGSTARPILVTHHAGIAKVLRYGLTL